MPNVLCDALGISHPIILGGLARIGRAPLVAAVSNAGGLGLLGAGSWTASQLSEQIREARALTNNTFGTNIPLHSSEADHLVEAAITEGLPVVSTSAGDPRRFTARFKEAGLYVIHVVSTVAQAMTAERAGVDAIVAEGSESGGMTSMDQVSTLVLVPQVAEAVRCPVIAAGGIADARGLAAAFALGAVGVQIGTALMATKECEIPPAFKEMMIRAKETDTYLEPLGRAGSRRFKAAFAETALQELKEAESPTIPDLDLMQTGVGQVTGMVREVRSVAEVIGGMVSRAREILPGLITHLPSESRG
jgi:enoyl-[acyl-carrier protein] reductase II